MKAAYLLVLSVLLTACSGSKLIRNDGLKTLSLGDEMIPQGTLEYQGKAVRDTLFREGGYEWRAAILDYAKGPVYVEEDFFGSGTVNRIRIQTPQLKVKGKGHTVGMPLAELLAQQRHWHLNYIPTYGLMDLSSPTLPGIHYLVKAQEPVPGLWTEQEPSLDALSPEAEVVAIVVM